MPGLQVALVAEYQVLYKSLPSLKVYALHLSHFLLFLDRSSLPASEGGFSVYIIPHDMLHVGSAPAGTDATESNHGACTYVGIPKEQRRRLKHSAPPFPDKF